MALNTHTRCAREQFLNTLHSHANIFYLFEICCYAIYVYLHTMRVCADLYTINEIELMPPAPIPVTHNRIYGTVS